MRKGNLPAHAPLFVLTPSRHCDIPIRVDGHVKNDRPTTNLAIFNVVLLRQRIVHQHRYRFAAIGAIQMDFREFGHLISVGRTSRSVKQTPHRRMPIHLLAAVPFRSAGIAVDIRFKELTIHPLLNIIVCGDTRHYRR